MAKTGILEGMKIAYFSDNSYPELSGIVDSIHITGKELEKRGHEVVFVGPHYSTKNYEKAKRVKTLNTLGEEVVNGQRIIRLPSVPLPFSPTGQSRLVIPFGTSSSFLDSFKPDIIHTQSPYGTGLEAASMAKRYNIPLIGTNHTPIEEFYPYAPTLMRHFDAWYYNKCDFVTAPYQGLIDNMRTFGFKKPGHGLANPVPFAQKIKSEEVKNACKADMNIKGHMILVSGRLAPEKRVDVIIDALSVVLKTHPDTVLVITGHGSAEPTLKAQAKKLGIESNVRFEGFISPDRLEEFYCSADMYVIMSSAETQSLSLMQALANGVPSIAAKARGLIDYCPPEAGFQVEPGDVEGLAKRMSVLLSDETLRTKLGQAGTQFVKQFTPEHIAEIWEAIYKNAITQYRQR